MTPRADFFTGIGLVVFSATMFSIAGKMAKPASYGLGPGGYPMLVAGVLIVLGTILGIQGWLGMRRLSASKTDDGAPKKNILTFTELRGIALLAISFWAYVFIVKYMGYLITTPVFLFLFLFQYGGRKWLSMVLISIISTFVTWALFVYAFRIYLPDFYFF